MAILLLSASLLFLLGGQGGNLCPAAAWLAVSHCLDRTFPQCTSDRQPIILVDLRLYLQLKAELTWPSLTMVAELDQLNVGWAELLMSSWVVWWWLLNPANLVTSLDSTPVHVTQVTRPLNHQSFVSYSWWPHGPSCYVSFARLLECLGVLSSRLMDFDMTANITHTTVFQNFPLFTIRLTCLWAWWLP